MPFQNVYVYERNLDGKNVIVIMNGGSKNVELPMERYAEITRNKNSRTDIFTGRTVALDGTLSLKAKEILVLE